MIAHIFDDLCNGCTDCVSACSTHVLDVGESVPVIARLDQCQTCYMCELYCTSYAIYVAPDQHQAEIIDPAEVRASSHLGRVRRDHGWDRPDEPGHLDRYRLLGPLLQGGHGNRSPTLSVAAGRLNAHICETSAKGALAEHRSTVWQFR